MTADTTGGFYRRISGVLSFTDFGLSSFDPGGGGQGSLDYTIVHGQTLGLSKYRCETICLKDFEVVKSWIVRV